MIITTLTDKLIAFSVWTHNKKIRFMKLRTTAKSSIHSVRKIGERGRFILVECKNCKERALAVDKKEAEEIYSRMECKI